MMHIQNNLEEALCGNSVDWKTKGLLSLDCNFSLLLQAQPGYFSQTYSIRKCFP